MYHPLLLKSDISSIKLFPVVVQTNSYLAPKTRFLMTALILSRQQCLISLCHKAGDLILCGVYIGLYENVGLYNILQCSELIPVNASQT